MEKTYDIIVDTTKTSAFQCAEKILAYIEKNPIPNGFQLLEKSF